MKQGGEQEIQRLKYRAAGTALDGKVTLVPTCLSSAAKARHSLVSTKPPQSNFHEHSKVKQLRSVITQPRAGRIIATLALKVIPAAVYKTCDGNQPQPVHRRLIRTPAHLLASVPARLGNEHSTRVTRDGAGEGHGGERPGVPKPPLPGHSEPGAAHAPLLSLNNCSNEFPAFRCRSAFASPRVPTQGPTSGLSISGRVPGRSASRERGTVSGIWGP